MRYVLIIRGMILQNITTMDFVDNRVLRILNVIGILLVISIPFGRSVIFSSRAVLFCLIMFAFYPLIRDPFSIYSLNNSLKKNPNPRDKFVERSSPHKPIRQLHQAIIDLCCTQYTRH